ncbi:MAG TPA: hypothetical protein VKU60_05925 [Chloroflexota bacterium]|nr:hypothetical protein [Chloroflexota bacterium]
MPALVLLLVLVVVVAPPVVELEPATPAGAADELAPTSGEEAPAEPTPAAELLGETAKPGDVEVLTLDPPKLTAPTASWTLRGGGGMTPLRI